MWYSFLVANGGGRDLSQYIKKALCCSSGYAHVREVSPVPSGLRLAICTKALEAVAGDARPVGPVQYTHLQLAAAPPAPVHALENRRCRLGWESGVWSRGCRRAEAVSAGAVPSGGFGGGFCGKLAAWAVAAGTRFVAVGVERW